MNYRVVYCEGRDVDLPAEPYDFRAESLKEDYGLHMFTTKEVREIWEKYSDSMSAGWMSPDKESVEQTFKVRLEEIENTDFDGQ